ncbi:MAG: HD domain-containing protein [archaeon]|jgi:HD superfamily phosphodiesterase|nr:HD domain-containing protein [archaeon]
MNSKIEMARSYMIETISKSKADPFGLAEHVAIVERWAKYLLKSHPEADEEVVLLGVWLHDIGHYPPDENDHAVKGEKLAVGFLKKLKLSKERISKIAHCVRAHRCKDVLPESIEAKIIACADSASHLTDFAYIDIVMRNKGIKEKYSALDKLERDYRDVAIFPEVKQKLEKLYLSWKRLLEEFEKINEEI